jgi:hypothetical protein
MGEYILRPDPAFELDFLAGFYYGGHNDKSRLISKGLGLESGLNAGIRLDRHYIYYMFRAATYVDYGDGENTVEDSLTNGVGYRYFFGDEPQKPETLADERRREEWRAEDAEMKTRYPAFGLGLWGGMSLENEADHNEEMGEPKYPVTVMAFADMHFTENFGLALETGMLSFGREENKPYSPHHDVTTSEFIVSVFEEFSFPLGRDFQLDLLAGLYYGGHVKGFGVEGGANLRLTQGNHSFAAMFRMGQSFKKDDLVDYGYTEDPDDYEEICVIGGGYIYSFQAGTADSEPLPSRYTQGADEDPADTGYPFVRTGGWWGISTLETDEDHDENSRVFAIDLIFSDYFALGVEAGPMAFRMTEENFWGYSRNETDSFFTTALVAEFITRPSDMVEASVLLGTYYRGGKNGGMGLFYCGANAGFVIGRHHVFGAVRYARDGFSSGADTMTTVGGGYKYDLY